MWISSHFYWLTEVCLTLVNLPFIPSGFQIQLRPRGGRALPEEPGSQLPEISLPAALHQRVCGWPLRQGFGRQVAADQIQVFLLFFDTSQQSERYSLPHPQQPASVPQRVLQLIAHLQPLACQLRRKSPLIRVETGRFNISLHAALLAEQCKCQC